MCRVVRHTIQALPLRSMLISEICRDKTEMFTLTRLLRTVLFLTGLFVASTSVVAQSSTVIEPCPATPAQTPALNVPAKARAKVIQAAVVSSMSDDPAVTD